MRRLMISDHCRYTQQAPPLALPAHSLSLSPPRVLCSFLSLSQIILHSTHLSLVAPPPKSRTEHPAKRKKKGKKITVRRMRKNFSGGFSGGGAAGKFFLCFETTPLVAMLLAFNVLMLVYNLQPYYERLLSSSPCLCSTSTTATATTAAVNFLNTTSVTTTPLVSLSTKPTQTQKLSVRKIRTPWRSKPDPNKREFNNYGNAAALFVQMGAYRGGPTSFAVVGLASKPLHVYGHPWFKCEWVSQNGSATFRAKAHKILPDWGYGRVYTVVVVNCTFPSNPNSENSGGKLNVYAYYSLSPRKFEKFTALEETPGSYNESKYKPPFQYDYLYCGSSLYGNISAQRMREWVAYHAWFFGSNSHFVFHDAGGVDDEVRRVLEPWVKLGRVTVQDIRDQENFDGYYYNQFLVVNDCLHRYRFAANWTFFFDVDEYIYLSEGNNKLEQVMKEFENYTQFTIEQNPMSSKLCFNGSTQDYARQWGLEKLLFRDSRTRIRRDRKYAIQARNAFATGVHMSENVAGKALHRTEAKIRYYHYHNSIQVMGEPCREFLPPSAKDTVTWSNKLPYVYDDRMKKLTDTIKQFERQTLGDAQLPL